MSSEAAISLQAVWKRYLLGHGGGARGVVAGLLGRGPAARDHWALKDLDLSVRPGESLGLIGHNGAGKTTALKLIAGITRPTRGSVAVQGRIASLINLGAGFHRELSGRENVLLNGVLLGLSRQQVQARYEQIVAFSGLEPGVLEAPVKQYSTGMYARLGFAVAAHADPDVLLVDEVLSVGDATFQDRSMRRMLAFRNSGTAVVFVSHNLSAVEMMCERAAWLDHGQVVHLGPTAEVIRAYLDSAGQAAEDQRSNARASMLIDEVTVLDGSGQETETLESDQPFTVRVRGRAVRDLPEPVFVISIRSAEGPLFAGNMHIDGNWPTALDAGPFTVECRFDGTCLTPGRYRVEIKVKQNVRTNYFEPRTLARFNVGAVDAWGSGADVPRHWRLPASTGAGR